MQPPSQWQCSRCTLLNNPSDLKCAVCEAPNPNQSAARGPPQQHQQQHQQQSAPYGLPPQTMPISGPGGGYGQYQPQYQQQQQSYGMPPQTMPINSPSAPPPGRGYGQYQPPPPPRQQQQSAGPPGAVGVPPMGIGMSMAQQQAPPPVGANQQPYRPQQQQQQLPTPVGAHGAVPVMQPTSFDPNTPWTQYNMSQYEYDRLLAMFMTFDYDGSGELNRRELTRLATWLNFPHTPRDVDMMFQQMDTDRSGSLSLH
eukprot:PhM_4_TR2883/c2_g1_i1/m.44434